MDSYDKVFVWVFSITIIGIVAIAIASMVVLRG